ncbi:hypothetical protein KPP03845_105079 [Streptomyces xanthophaeus]|uniref:hypothetical protein n=1 Tax=Streptomyces xanthophaeus TaxID=67385 RepID=UPI00233F26AC|nr:hypothetical protein [Streptomyces xanthophaeus]WCD88670.1 hypothetical protein KPP03845_105079 [Streptomyces xanthophaeus]
MKTSPFRTATPVPTVVTALAVLLALPLLAGCGEAGGLAGAGPTPTASGPVHLWPGRQQATVPPADPGGAPPEYVKGIPPVRNQDVHEVDPLALVQAEVRTHPDTFSGSDAMPAETAAAITACGKDGQDPAACPVLTPYYRDLTGNDRDELIVGIELPDRMMSVRVYTADPDGRLNRIMATTQTVISVELAGRDVVLRVPSGNDGYELITAWSWDGKQRSMLPTREEIVRVPSNPQTQTPTRTPAQTPTQPQTQTPAPGPSPAPSTP